MLAAPLDAEGAPLHDGDGVVPPGHPAAAELALAPEPLLQLRQLRSLPELQVEEHHGLPGALVPAVPSPHVQPRLPAPLHLTPRKLQDGRGFREGGVQVRAQLDPHPPVAAGEQPVGRGERSAQAGRGYQGEEQEETPDPRATGQGRSCLHPAENTAAAAATSPMNAASGACADCRNTTSSGESRTVSAGRIRMRLRVSGTTLGARRTVTRLLPGGAPARSVHQWGARGSPRRNRVRPGSAPGARWRSPKRCPGRCWRRPAARTPNASLPGSG